MPGGPQQSVDEHGEDGGVDAVDGIQLGQVRIGHAYMKKKGNNDIDFPHFYLEENNYLAVCA